MPEQGCGPPSRVLLHSLRSPTVMSPSSPSPSPSRKPKPVPERFQVAKTTLWFDRIMTKTIIGGGFTVIVAVFGILFFLLPLPFPSFKVQR